MTEDNVLILPDRSAEIRRQKRRRKIRRRKITVTIILIIGVMIGIMFTPLFDLQHIVLNGNSRVTVDEVIKKGGIATGDNIFALNLKKIGDGVSKIPYIDTIEVKRGLPDKLIVNITECVPIAVMKTKKGYAVIDKNGKILEALTDKGTYMVPEIMGFVSETVKPLEKISVKEEEIFKKTLEILRDLYNNNFIDVISSISVSEKNIVMKKSDTFVIEMGGFEQFNAKIVMVKEILAGLPSDAVGTLDASNADRVYYDKTNPVEPQEENLENAQPSEEAESPKQPATTEQLYN